MSGADRPAALPRLHVITDDVVLAGRDFVARARAVLSVLGGRGALHLRGHATAGAALYQAAAALAPAAGEAGALLLVNDRLDVAAAAGAHGAQLGRRSLTLADARALLGPGAVLGYSAHAAQEAVRAARAGADFVVLGSVWETPSHPAAAAAGLELLEVAARVAVPVLAIGGVTPARVAAARAAGAHGVAVLSGVWGAADPAEAARAYTRALETYEGAA